LINHRFPGSGCREISRGNEFSVFAKDGMLPFQSAEDRRRRTNTGKP